MQLLTSESFPIAIARRSGYITKFCNYSRSQILSNDKDKSVSAIACVTNQLKTKAFWIAVFDTGVANLILQDAKNENPHRTFVQQTKRDLLIFSW